MNPNRKYLRLPSLSNDHSRAGEHLTIFWGVSRVTWQRLDESLGIFSLYVRSAVGGSLI